MAAGTTRTAGIGTTSSKEVVTSHDASGRKTFPAFAPAWQRPAFGAADVLPRLAVNPPPDGGYSGANTAEGEELANYLDPIAKHLAEEVNEISDYLRTELLNE